MTWKAVLLVAFGAVAAGCTPSGNDGVPTVDPAVAEGRTIVETYCADCHATGPTGDSQLAIAPPLRELHLRYDVELLSEALVEGLVTGHEEMPEFEFDPDQAEGIVRYLKSLEPPPS